MLLYLKSLLLVFLVFSLWVGCKKRTESDTTPNGYSLTTVYKNALNIPVVLQYFTLILKPTGDTALYKEWEKIKIDPGTVYSSTEEVCTKDCPYNSLNIYYYPKNMARIFAGTKYKADADCDYIQDASRQNDCIKDSISLFNEKRWVTIKNKFADVMRTYEINQSDLREIK